MELLKTDSNTEALKAYMAHGTTYQQELQRDCEKRTWIHDRVSEIMADKDYTLDLVQYAIESPESFKLFNNLKNATYGSSISALAAFHEELTRQARMIAESEARVRFGS